MGKAKYFIPKASPLDLHTDSKHRGATVEGKEIFYIRK